MRFCGGWMAALVFIIPLMSVTAQAQPSDAGHVHPASASVAGDSFFSNLLKIYVPRRECMFNETSLIWLHLVSDTLIALAYYSIPLALVYFVRRRKDLAFEWMFVCFAVFILACGTTHVMNVLAIWWPAYRVDGFVKLLTAVVSVGTAVLLWPLIPRALALPSPAQLRLANSALSREIQERRQAEETMQRMHEQLELRVSERTAELRTLNDRLSAELEERKKLELGQARLAAIVESSDAAIISKTLQGEITSWNRGAEQLFEYSAEEIVGMPVETIVPADRVEEEREILSKLRRGERVEHLETVRRTKSGRELHVSLNVSPIREQAGPIVAVSTIARDISQQKRAEKEREELLAAERVARSEAERANRLKDEFLATLSHELRTPLNSILGWVSVLQRREATSEDVHQGLEVIERSTRIQVQLIEDLLDMSRIVSGKMRLDLQPVDLATVIQEALEGVKPAADAKGIRMQPALDPLAGPVTGDPARLQQVIWNLLNNAIKFTERGGRVQVFLERVNSHLEITVADTGKGIKPEFLPFVFERFRQGEAGLSRVYGGLGLGLAIVRHVVEMHGGTVRAKSEGEGRGATFTVSLPLRVVPREHPELNVHPTRSQYAAPQHIPRLDGLKVLIVEDEPDARHLAGMILEQRGATVVRAASAAEGIDLLRDQRPDVLISDIGLPGEDGYGFIRRVRKLPRDQGGDVPAIALTAFARSEDRQFALLSGFQMHLSKPVEPDELIIVVANLARK